MTTTPSGSPIPLPHPRSTLEKVGGFLAKAQVYYQFYLKESYSLGACVRFCKLYLLAQLRREQSLVIRSLIFSCRVFFACRDLNKKANVVQR
jgi:hypothetical protein